MKKFVISEEEKKHIRGLYETQSKTQIKEETLGLEPIVERDSPKKFTVKFFFNTGCPNYSCPNPQIMWMGDQLGWHYDVFDGRKKQIRFQEIFVRKLKEYFKTIGLKSLLVSLNKHNIPLPNFIDIKVATSHEPGNNQKVANQRIQYVQNLLITVFKELNLYTDKIEELLVNSSKTNYQPTDTDCEVIDCKTEKGKPYERIAEVSIYPFRIKGLNSGQIGDVGGTLIDASSDVNSWFYDKVNEEGIIKALERLQTYSDLTDLEKFLQNARKGKLEDFLNDQLSNYPKNKIKAVNIINQLAKKSGKGNIAKMTQNKDIAIVNL